MVDGHAPREGAGSLPVQIRRSKRHWSLVLCTNPQNKLILTDDFLNTSLHRPLQSRLSLDARSRGQLLDRLPALLPTDSQLRQHRC